MAKDLSIVDKLVDNDGLKFSVNLDVAPDIYIKLFLTITLAVIVSVAGVTALQNVFKN